VTAADEARMTGNFVVLRADSLRLLLPQQEVGAAEYVERSPTASGQPGVFEHGAGEVARFVMALSQQMRPLPAFPDGRFVLTALLTQECELWFAWNEVRVLIDAALVRHPLPPAMRMPGAPIDSYVEHEGELLLCSTAERVITYAAAAGD
jgi:hypothetical protein